MPIQEEISIDIGATKPSTGPAPSAPSSSAAVDRSGARPVKSEGERNDSSDRLKAALRRKQEVVCVLQARIEDQQRSYASALREKDQKLAELSARISEKERELNALTSTLGWRALSHYGKFKHRFLLPILRTLGFKRSRTKEEGSLQVYLANEITRRVIVDKGGALYIAGCCAHSSQNIRKLELSLNGKRQPLKTVEMAAPELISPKSEEQLIRDRRYPRAFWAIRPLQPIGRPTELKIEIRAVLSNGAAYSQVIAEPVLEPGTQEAAATARSEIRSVMEPLVAICMTTFNPPINLFERQIRSIVDQTHARWVCTINDDCSRPEIYREMSRLIAGDERFSIHRNQATLGFYRNFEACLSLTPPEADFVALCDHDDYWHPDKVAALIAEFDSETALVYSDMNIVAEDGSRLSDTYWTTRRNNYQDFASLVFANTITGAASMIPARLLSYILPFPDKIGDAYHDHWIGCVAMASGKVKYVNRPLYDYVQHSANVLGHYAPHRDKGLRRLTGILQSIRKPGRVFRENMATWGAIYFNDLLRLQLISEVLLVRCGPRLTAAKRNVLRRISKLDESPLAFTWLWVRSLRNVGGLSETLGAENRLVKAVVWKAYRTLSSWFRLAISRRGSSRSYSNNQPDLSAVVTTPGAPASPVIGHSAPIEKLSDSSAEAQAELEIKPDEGVDPSTMLIQAVDAIQQKIEPLLLDISACAPRRVNLIIPSVDSKYLFGGYITKFNLAKRLAETGFNVRIIAVDYCGTPPDRWAEELEGFPGIESLFEQVDTAYAFDRTSLLEVSPDDVFIATTWWTAQIAHQAVKELGKPRFVYLIQEFEPFTFPMGTFASLANQTYAFPHYAVFSTEFLRDYFRQNSIGVYREGLAAGQANSTSFQNAITSVGEIAVSELAARSPKRLLLYARPESHAARNMFEMAILAISRAVKAGYFEGDWEFHGIGTVGLSAQIPLSADVQMQILPRENQSAYREVLRSHDLGVSLMYTPHPGLVPIEMASAGMLVVTNTYATKTSDKLLAISPNIIPAEPCIEALSLAIKDAVSRVGDCEQRVVGSKVRWSSDWSDAFNYSVWSVIEQFVADARP